MASRIEMEGRKHVLPCKDKQHEILFKNWIELFPYWHLIRPNAIFFFTLMYFCTGHTSESLDLFPGHYFRVPPSVRFLQGSQLNTANGYVLLNHFPLRRDSLHLDILIIIFLFHLFFSHLVVFLSPLYPILRLFL